MRRYDWRYPLYIGLTLAALLIGAGARWRPSW